MRDSRPGRTGPAALPSMTALLDAAAADARFAGVPRSQTKSALAETLADCRRQCVDGGTHHDAHIHTLLASAARRLAALRRAALHPVINATGVVLHTGLGRAMLAAGAVDAVVRASGYCNLEFDLDSGERGRRGAHAEDLLCRLTGAPAAMVVNNNAAATMLVLAGFAAGREVIVSRGQLIEIGGSFRLPDVMACSGATMREVGTTNKTRIDDYEAAVTDQTALLLHVHTSNYRIEGFAETPDTAALSELARRRRLLLYDDLGSGALFDDPLWSSTAEPTVVASIAAGADILSFSGDKLLGGPQAGLILGRPDLVKALRRHPMARALRVDKLTLAALEATLQLYFDPPSALREIPALAMLHASVGDLELRARRLHDMLAAALPGVDIQMARSQGFAGGGTLPARALTTYVVTILPPATLEAGEFARRLRWGIPPVVSRVEGGRVVLDVRTLREDDLSPLVEPVRHALQAS